MSTPAFRLVNGVPFAVKDLCPYCHWISTGEIIIGTPCGRHEHHVEDHLYGNPWDMRPCAECRRMANPKDPQ